MPPDRVKLVFEDLDPRVSFFSLLAWGSWCDP